MKLNVSRDVRDATQSFLVVIFALALSCLLVIVAGAASPARAYAESPAEGVAGGTSVGAPDLTKTCSLSAECLVSGKSVSGLQLSLYRVATFNDDASFTLTSDFASSGVEVTGITKASEWADVATKLDSFARKGNLAPRAQATTSSAGVASFSGLEPGLYLATRAVGYVGDAPYTNAAFLVSLPGETSTNGMWNYHVAVEPKFEQGDLTGDESGNGSGSGKSDGSGNGDGSGNDSGSGDNSGSGDGSGNSDESGNGGGYSNGSGSNSASGSAKLATTSDSLSAVTVTAAALALAAFVTAAFAAAALTSRRRI